MAILNPSTVPAGSPPAGPIEQLLVMHCLKEDSVMGREGFSVRAASPGATDPATLDWALRLDAYELPLDMKSGALLANQAPRRLARVPGPPGRVALVHTSYLPEDTVGRSHSCISQIILLPELETIPAATAWGASDWQTDEYARGETKSLLPLDHLPHGDLIDDAALTAFLSGGASPADQSLARSIYPGRVESKPEVRWRWIRGALHGFLRTGEANAVRTRVCILAEPGAVALLVYAISRLLPPQIVGTFPFSTYEPPHSSLRENKVARVIGSYARNGIDRADSDALRRRAYVVDTLRDAYGPELLIEPSWPLEGLLNLVADGNWTAVNEIRDLWSRDPQIARASSPELLAQAIRVRPLAAALKAGTIDVDGLVELRRSRFGEGLLHDDELRHRAWETVRKVWTRPKVRDEFAELLREHLNELLAEVRKRVQSEPTSAWREGWEVLKPLVQADHRAACFVTLLEAVAATPTAAVLAPDTRVSLLREWSQSAPAGAAIPAGLHWLIRATDPPAFRALVRSSGLDPRHAGLAACLVLSGSAGWQPDLGLLIELNDDQFRSFVAELERFDRLAAVLERLRADRNLADTLVDRVRRTRPKVSPAWLEELLLAVRCDEAAWRDYWLKNKHFHEVLSLLDTESRESRLSRRLWALLVESITIDNYDESTLSPVLESLAGLSDQFSRSVTSEHAERLKGWNTLSIHFASPPKSPDPATTAKLRSACKAVGQTPESLAEWWFDKWVVRARNDLDRAKKNGVLGRAILGFVESEDQAWEIALKLAARVPDPERRRECKTDLFNNIVSEGNKDRLAQTFERELRETSISPRLKLRDPIGGRGGGKKGLGVGKFRLPPKATPYVGGFVGGVAFTTLLMLLLMPLIGGAFEFVSTMGRSTSSEEDGGNDNVKRRRVTDNPVPSKRIREKSTETPINSEPEVMGPDTTIAELNATVRDLNTKLEAGKSEIEELKRKLDDRKKQIEPTTKGGKPVTAHAEARPPVGNSPAPSPPTGGVAKADSVEDATKVRGGDRSSPAENGEDGIILKLFNAFVVDRPLHNKRDFDKALSLADALSQAQRGGPEATAASQAKRLLTGLTVQDVSIDPSAQGKLDPDYSMTDLAFLRDPTDGASVLATLRSLPGTLSNSSTLQFFFVEIGQGFTLRKVPWRQYDFLTASSSGRYFVIGRREQSGSGGLFFNDLDLIPIKPERRKDKIQPKEDGKDIEVNPNVSTKLAVSNNKRIAIAKFDSGRSDQLPIVEFRTPSDGAKPRALDFKPFEGEFTNGWKISAMSFDEDAQTLVVGFERPSLLLAFGLKDNSPTSHKISCDAPVRGWSLSPNGRLAIATESQVFVGNLTDQISNGRPGVLLPQGSPSDHLSCVALSPSGTILATGNESGSVAIRLLGEPNRAREVLRLAHLGPIWKVGFSPDGRFLAALARSLHGRDNLAPQEILIGDKDKVSSGVIRLWATEKWKRGEDKLGGTPKASP
jgi:WD40 repeat protein